MYPGLDRSLKIDLSSNEWDLVKDYIIEASTLTWHEDPIACKLLESAVKKAIANDYFHCASCILHYYDNFYCKA